MNHEKSSALTEGTELVRITATIQVTDIQRATDFYIGLFNLKKVFENGDPVGFVILKNGPVSLSLTLNRDLKASIHGPAHFLVADADAAYQRCIQMGVRIIKGIRDKPYGLRDFIVADPDGNRLDIGSELRTP